MNAQDIISKFETLAKAAGLSIDALCKKAGLNRATWQRWKSGEISPTLKNLQKVENALIPDEWIAAQPLSDELPGGLKPNPKGDRLIRAARKRSAKNGG